jgi:hexosaminidase
MRWWATLIVCGLAGFPHVAGAATSLSIVPEPRHVEAGQGVFALHRHDRIAAPGDPRAQWIAGFLRDAIRARTGVAPVVTMRVPRARIALRIDPSIRGDEAYRLSVTPARIVIAASGDRGLFWGVQTLRQLLPGGRGRRAKVPAVKIEDAPRFPWRGVMLDVSRHFLPVGFVEKQIDLMSYYKFDVLHWHLTDDQGWRIQINRYPKLTRVGAWRVESDGKRYGGFYTQEQIREVVAYAAHRNVMVVPEIEMPGHTSAAIAAYPELSCSGRPIDVPVTWGVFRNVDCVGNDRSFTFLENVLDEVAPLFPAPYVHIGGDEVPEGVWQDCGTCRRLPRADGLEGEPGLHGYFVDRIRKYLAAKGKTLVGWDEILEGHLEPDAIVDVWRGPDEAKKALANGNRIIVAGPFYLDTPIDDMTLEDLYRIDPFDDPVYARHAEKVLGGEAPLWSERVTPLNADAMLYPRLLAIAEHMWNPDAHNYPDFLGRARAQYRWLASQGVAYGPEDRDVVDYRLHFVPAYERWRVRAERGFGDLRLHYTTDGSQPTARSPSFGDVLDLYAPATLAIAPFRGDTQYHAPTPFRIVPNLALGKPVTYAMPPEAPYAGGPTQLVDGILGSTEFHDGAWAGWQGADMNAVIDMQQPTILHSIDARFLQESGAWILLPREVRFEVSNDGKTWNTLQATPLRVDPYDAETVIRDVTCAPPVPVSARYVRVVATRFGQTIAGLQTWIFSDEIIVR